MRLEIIDLTFRLPANDACLLMARGGRNSFKLVYVGNAKSQNILIFSDFLAVL